MDGRNLAGKLTIGLLLVAVLPLPYSYYMFLRWAVTLSAGFYMVLAFQRRLWGIAAACAGIAALFNPLVTAYLTKEIWIVLDITAAAFFGYTSARLSKPPKSLVR